MKNWTLANAPVDLSDKIYVITGTSSGIGVVIAYELAKRGALVIAGNRNIDKAHKAIKAVRTLSDDLSSLKIMLLDVSSLKSIREFAEKVNSDGGIPKIDGLLLNAGIMALPERRVSVDGFELQMATNVLGHHLLTSLLMDKIKLAQKSVIVSTSSSASNNVSRRELWNDLNAEKKYDPWEVYGVSKMAAIQFRDGLREILEDADLENKIYVHSTHPGLTATPLFDVSKGVLASIFRSVKGIFMMDVAQGALSTLRAALDETLPNGSFIGPGGFTGMSGNPKVVKVYKPKLSLDPILREKMWNYCDDATAAVWSISQ